MYQRPPTAQLALPPTAPPRRRSRSAWISAAGRAIRQASRRSGPTAGCGCSAPCAATSRSRRPRTATRRPSSRSTRRWRCQQEVAASTRVASARATASCARSTGSAPRSATAPSPRCCPRWSASRCAGSRSPSACAPPAWPSSRSTPGCRRTSSASRRKRDRPGLLRGLRRAGIRGIPRRRRPSHDELDAATAALVGMLHLEGRTEIIGPDGVSPFVAPLAPPAAEAEAATEAARGYNLARASTAG